MRWKLTTGRRSFSEQVFRGFYAVVAVAAIGLIVGVLFLGVGLAQGYRPVVLTSGSMTPTAPVGSVVIARPVDTVQIGDILVMSNEARATVTHRIVEIETSDTGQAFAVTRGDANSEVDAEPFALNGPQLVGRWIVPGLGSALLWLGSPLIGLVVVGGAILLVMMSALSYIWSSSDEPDDDQHPDHSKQSGGEPVERGEGGRELAGSGQKRFAVGISLSILLGFTGLAWSLYLSTNSVVGNAFSTSDCFDARLAGVQSGQVTSTTNGVTTVPITAVVPSASFVTFSVRSGSTKPGDAVVLGDLSSATTVEFLRQTDTATPPPIVIEWSVVEYDCGVTVQRGSSVGNGTATVDFSINPVAPEGSFVIGGTVGAGFNAAFGSDDVAIVELVGDDTVRFRTNGEPLAADRAIGFQVIEFNNAGDVLTQVVAGSLGAGTATQTLTLSQPVDVAASMVLATFTTSDKGPDVGQRMVRARLLDSSTVEIQRAATGQTLDVQVQVVQFLDGTTVQQGVVDLLPGALSANVPVSPVDLSRTTVGSTVLIGGASSGGSTDHVAAGVVGEGLVSASFVDASTVAIERVPSSSTASFAWQAITWGGPSWVDPNSPYRQRIDVDAATVDVPNGYTTPLTFDHAAMVASGLSSASGDDLRLWRFDGTTWTELDRVLDEDSAWNGATSTFWFRTQESIAASTTVSYWLYFGDPAPAPPLADPDNVWLVNEDFEGGLGVFEDRTEGTAWYRAEPWTRRVTLTVDAATVGSPLTNQAVLVTITDPDLSANAQADGSDLFFTDAGGSRLPHDIERWDTGTGTLAAWVLVATLDDSVDTTLFLYYGAPDAPLQTNPRGTWANQGAVWNMTGDPTAAAPALDDRGAGNIDGVAFADTQRVVIGGTYSARLDGTADRLQSAPFRMPDGPFSASAWFRADVITGDVVLASQGLAPSGVFELGIDNTTSPGSPVARASLELDGATVAVTGGAIAPGTWHHVTMVWDQATLELFIDGASTASMPTTGALPPSRTAALVVGGDEAGARTLDGEIGQVRLRYVALSPDQIAFESTNLATPNSAIVAGGPIGGTFSDQGDWSLRRPLLIDADLADSDVVDFALLVQLVDLDLGSNAQIDGDDLVFTAADGVTRLDHHLESWNAATGAITAWVRLPLLSSTTDTELFLYLSNPLAGDQNDPIGVWDSEADLVLPGS